MDALSDFSIFGIRAKPYSAICNNIHVRVHKLKEGEDEIKLQVTDLSYTLTGKVDDLRNTDWYAALVEELPDPEPAEGQQLFHELYPFSCSYITIQVMTVSLVSPAHKDAVHTLLKSQEDMVGRNTGRTHDPNHADVGRVLQTTDPSQVSSGICSPRT